MVLVLQPKGVARNKNGQVSIVGGQLTQSVADENLLILFLPLAACVNTSSRKAGNGQDLRNTSRLANYCLLASKQQQCCLFSCPCFFWVHKKLFSNTKKSVDIGDPSHKFLFRFLHLTDTIFSFWLYEGEKRGKKIILLTFWHKLVNGTCVLVPSSPTSFHTQSQQMPRWFNTANIRATENAVFMKAGHLHINIRMV